MTTFNGFPKNAVSFLLDLRHNNDREWFKEHKPEFDEYVTAPAKEFSAAMTEALGNALEQTDGDQPVKYSIFRIYRDIRFSKDKTPYKTHIGIWFWQGERPRMENSGFYFHLEPPKLMLAAGIHTFPKPLLQAYRNAVVSERYGPSLLNAMGTMQAEADYDIGQKGYKRVPRGFDKDHPHADWLLYKGLTVAEEDLIPDELYSPELIDFCMQSYRRMFPLHNWLKEMIANAAELAGDD